MMLLKLWMAGCVVAMSLVAHAQDTVSVVVERGESLGTIASRYLKAPGYAHWTEIAKLNRITQAPYAIHPGMVLKLPANLLVTKASSAKWLAVSGQVQVTPVGSSQSRLAVVGGTVEEGTRISVGADASAFMELADGSQVKLLNGAELVLDESRYSMGYFGKEPPESPTGTKAFAGLLRLIQGAIETKATPASDRAKPLRIQTPTAVVGVRGTDFRVSHRDATRTEVTSGLVLAQLDESRKSDVAGGFGVKLDPNSKDNPVVVPLLDAPDLGAWLLKQETLTVEFPVVPSVQKTRGVTGYRVQVASDVAMTKVIFNQLFQSGKAIRIPNLADGAWHLAVRAVDAQGIEGKNASALLVLKARPQPPLIQSPKPNEKVAQGQDIPLAWVKVSGASGYVLDVQDEQKKLTRHTVQGNTLALTGLAVGSYRWRIATQVKTAQDQLDTGPWGEWQSFSVIPMPASAQGKVDPDGKSMGLRWTDQKAKEYEVQLAREPSFTASLSPVVTQKTNKPELTITRPEVGTHYIRYRSIEEDGFVSGWSGTMEIEVPIDWRPLWLFLGTTLLLAL